MKTEERTVLRRAECGRRNELLEGNKVWIFERTISHVGYISHISQSYKSVTSVSHISQSVSQFSS